ncbi:Piso0_005182 [Millerozyma farinosa CBS 7064]|uniref:Piso0_005182 protein n=1 Tax=Pichia sorbitophila (strain ATCC MYA-4447 / BCRC 22081 / CBS 7064 / NBRC 10061 / NRRL Y-12695) TaxID=559304 RepID=G8Y1H6_PICSO|nr:Piso0_005182 [Millerozyma farinosa CBS 7064]
MGVRVKHAHPSLAVTSRDISSAGSCSYGVSTPYRDPTNLRPSRKELEKMAEKGRDLLGATNSGRGPCSSFQIVERLRKCQSILKP